MQEIQVQFLGWEDALEKEMATHSSILAWKISWTEEPGGLQSTGSHRVGYDSSNSAAAAAATRKRRGTFLVNQCNAQQGYAHRNRNPCMAKE